MQRKKILIALFTLLICLFNLSGSLIAKKPKKKHKKTYNYNNNYNAYHPRDYKIYRSQFLRFKEKEILLDLYSKNFSQGQVIYLEIRKKISSNDKLKVNKIVFHNKNFKFSQHDFGYRALIPIHGNLKPGIKNMLIDYEIDSREITAKIKLKIKKSKFIFNKRPLDLGKHSNIEYQETPKNQEFIKECTEKKRKAFSTLSSNKILNAVGHPRDYHYVTSPFWAKRTIMQYKIRKKRKIRLKNRIKVHRGLDLRGEKGEYVYSISHGKVVLAEEMFYEGNFLVIDHGNKIFSYYMHLDKLDVNVGDDVEAGQKVARVGSSGVSTAAHLHVSFMIQGVQVHPLSLLGLPIRN